MKKTTTVHYFAENPKREGKNLIVRRVGKLTDSQAARLVLLHASRRGLKVKSITAKFVNAIP